MPGVRGCPSDTGYSPFLARKRVRGMVERVFSTPVRSRGWTESREAALPQLAKREVVAKPVGNWSWAKGVGTISGYRSDTGRDSPT